MRAADSLRMWEAIGAIAGVVSVVLTIVGLRQARGRTSRQPASVPAPADSPPVAKSPVRIYPCEWYSRLFKIRCRKLLIRTCPIDGKHYCHKHLEMHTASHSRRERRAAGIAT